MNPLARLSSTPHSPARPWLPWLALGVTVGAAGLVGSQWWWLALLAAPLAVISDGRWPIAARALAGLAAVCAGGWLATPSPSTEHHGPRLYQASGMVTNAVFVGQQQGFVLIPESTDDPGGYLPRRLFVVGPPLPAALEGDQMRVAGRWSRDARGERLDALRIERQRPRESGARGAAWQVLARVESHRTLAEALILGLGRPPEHEVFKRTGLIHVLAVSGMHLALAAAMGAWLLRQVGVGWLTRQLALAGLLIGYTWLTAASPATVRALAMALALTLYALSAREPQRLGAVSLAALGLVLYDPALARDLGFQLSLAAVLGIMTLGVDLMQLRGRWLPWAALPLTRPTWRALLFIGRNTLDGLAVGVAATLATAPILAATFGSVSWWSPLTTLLVSPPTTIALWTGLPLLGVAGAWPEGPWEGLYLVLEGALQVIVLAVNLADQLPGRVPMNFPPPLVILAWPLVFIPCQAEEPTAWPRATLVRVGVFMALMLYWIFCG